MGIERDWMTLAEGIEIVERMDAGIEEELRQPPLDQIFDAIEDGELRARWFDEIRVPTGIGIKTWVPDAPAMFRAKLRTLPLRFENGGEIEWDGRWRQLLLSREAMAHIFRPPVDNVQAKVKKLSNNADGKKAMHEAIAAVFELAREQGVKPPNKREMRGLAVRWLEKKHSVTAPPLWIEELTGDKRYAPLFGKPGVKANGRLRPISELQI